MFLELFVEGRSLGSVGTGRLSFLGFFDSLSSHSFVHAFTWICKEVVPNSLPLDKTIPYMTHQSYRTLKTVVRHRY